MLGEGRFGGEGLCDPLRMELEKKGRAHQVSFYRAGDETGVVGGPVSQGSRRGVGLPAAYC